MPGATAFARVAAVATDFGDRRAFLDVVVSMVLTLRPSRGVPTAPSPGSCATGAGRGHGASQFFRHLTVTLSWLGKSSPYMTLPETAVEEVAETVFKLPGND